MKVKLIDYMGSDKTVVDAARVSFDKVSEDVLTQKDENLIFYLAKHKHWTPFAHPQLTFAIEAPVFVRTQCFKHKVGFVENEVSRRYVDYEPTFFYPDAWRTRPLMTIKQGSGGTSEYNEEVTKQVENFFYRAKELYASLLTHGIAPEQARMVLPQAMYTKWYWTGSLAAYARFCALRLEASAQKEIQTLAGKIDFIIQDLFPISWRALIDGHL